MSERQERAGLSLLLFVVAMVAALSLGAIRVRRAYLTRGIPKTLPEPIAFGGPEAGVNVYLDSLPAAELEADLSAIRQAGFQTVKQSFYFSDDYDWDASDRLVEAIKRADLDLVPLLDGDSDAGFAPPESPTDFAAWAGSFASRYGRFIDYYVVWDEPNLMSHWGGRPVNADEYGSLLTSSATAIRMNDPEAAVVAAPLAPTVETGPSNMADHLFLQALYEAGAGDAFDIVGGKPYGFNSDPYDRTVNPDVLNFSRILLLREVMVRNGDTGKAIWAGNWGWNSLPSDWNGPESIWGQVDLETRSRWLLDGLERAQKEWPWMGLMFVENWKPGGSPTDPRWGFSIAGREVAERLALAGWNDSVAGPGFHLARSEDGAQKYTGDWRFSPKYGADVSRSGDKAELRFWGTDVGLRVRRADFRARVYATVDGQPANALPRDDRGAFLLLTSPTRLDDYLSTELVAQDLAPGEHVLQLEADRGWGQWALSGFSVGYRPPDDSRVAFYLLMFVGILALFGGLYRLYNAGWQRTFGPILDPLARLDRRLQMTLTLFVAGVLSLTGWLTWGQDAVGVYRRLGEGGQIAVTAAAATIFYVSPQFVVYILAIALLFALLYLRPPVGLALVVFAVPFHVKPKPMLGYQFSPVEVFVLLTFAVATTSLLVNRILNGELRDLLRNARRYFRLADLAVLSLVAVATISLAFTERLDVATNEWRVVIIEPALFYFLLRTIPFDGKDGWLVLDAFVAGSVAVAFIGLGQLAFGQNLITSEAGLVRIRSIFGSPNNLALYVGRVLPVVFSMALLGQGRRRLVYALAIIPLSVSFLLTFSKGGIFLGLPASVLIILLLWGRERGGRIWPWLVTFAVVALIALAVVFQIPELAARLDPRGATGVFRVNLWRSSLEMIREHPLFGVGLDNFLYAYRGRYIMDAAWQEPNLNHPHNIFLDFATRIGLLGLLAGLGLLYAYWRTCRIALRNVTGRWRPIAIALPAFLAYMFAHGLVDHSFFLVDLSFAFYLMMGIGMWLRADRA